MNALDLINAMPTTTYQQMENHPRSLLQGLFSLVCATEHFETLVGDRYLSLAEALCITSSKLYEIIHEDLVDDQSNVIVHPMEIQRTFKRFENVFSCLNQCYPDFIADDFRVESSWEKIQDLYRTTKIVLIRNEKYRC